MSLSNREKIESFCPSPSSGRDAYWDAVKGVGIVFVVIGHAVPYDSLAFRSIFMFHMPLFFFLSGMFSRPEKSWRDFGRRLWHGLGLPLLFFTCVSLLLARGVSSGVLAWIGRHGIFIFTMEVWTDMLILRTLARFSPMFGLLIPWQNPSFPSWAIVPFVLVNLSLLCLLAPILKVFYSRFVRAVCRENRT